MRPNHAGTALNIPNNRTETNSRSDRKVTELWSLRFEVMNVDTKNEASEKTTGTEVALSDARMKTRDLFYSAVR